MREMQPCTASQEASAQAAPEASGRRNPNALFRRGATSNRLASSDRTTSGGQLQKQLMSCTSAVAKAFPRVSNLSSKSNTSSSSVGTKMLAGKEDGARRLVQAEE
eukprot:6960481-Prymnesium_polylepis.1